MFVDNKVGPPGCNPLRNEDRMPVLKVISGDSWVVDAELVAADCGPASPKNSHVEFVLSENQFSPPIFVGAWFNGVIPDSNIAGLVHVVLPRDLTKTIRRGSYMFSMRVADKMKYSFNTQLVGNFLVEYMPTSDQRSIPYRDGTSEIFGANGCTNAPSEAEKEYYYLNNTYAYNPNTGLYHLLTVTRDENGGLTLEMSENGVKSRVSK